MTKRIIVYGNTIVSKMLFYNAMIGNHFDIACFTVNKEYLKDVEFLGLPLIHIEHIVDLYPPDEYDMVVGGYSLMRNREKMYLTTRYRPINKKHILCGMICH